MKTYKQMTEEFKIWRYKKPSLNTILGITGLKKKIRKETGINAIARLAPQRIKQRLLTRLGWYGNDNITTMRQLFKGKIRSPFKVTPDA